MERNGGKTGRSMAKIKRITIEYVDDGTDFDLPSQAPKLGDYGKYVPALTAPTRGEHPCTHCQNNPKNNPAASGICNCVLPTLWQTYW